MTTAVEWLFGETLGLTLQLENKRISHRNWELQMVKLFEQAKQMEKNNLYECGSFWRGKENKIKKPLFEQWYNETFKSE